MSLIAALREATRAQHEAIEASGWLDRATTDLQAYADHLARVAAFYRAAAFGFRPYLPAFEKLGMEPERRKKLPLLERELDALRMAGATPDPFAGAAFPALRDLSRALGAAYVLEGSTLGGALIAMVLRERLGWPSAFYGAYGPDSATRWRAFTGAFEAARSGIDLRAAAQAAQETFTAYQGTV